MAVAVDGKQQMFFLACCLLLLCFEKSLKVNYRSFVITNMTVIQPCKLLSMILVAVVAVDC